MRATAATSNDWKARQAATLAAIEAPEAGMAFHERFSVWRVVLKVTDSHVWYLNVVPPCTVPPDGELVVDTRQEWRRRMCYQTMPDTPYKILSDKRWDVDGWWIQYAEKALQRTASEHGTNG